MTRAVSMMCAVAAGSLVWLTGCSSDSSNPLSTLDRSKVAASTPASAPASVPSASEPSASASARTNESTQESTQESNQVSTGEDPDFVTLDDGRKIYYPCSGDGSTQVVLIAGLGNTSFVWSSVRPLLAASDAVRVCLFERAGLGPSDPPTGSVDATDAAADLLQVIEIEGISEHIVLVGASYGGLVTQLITRQHPELVAGVVLIDATHPDLDERIEEILPPEIAAERRDELGSGPELVTFDGLLASDDAVRAAPPFPPIPLIVLRHSEPFESTDADYPTDAVEELWAELQEDLAEASPCSTVRVADSSGHRIHQDQPDLTATAILDVVASIEEGTCPSGG